VKYHEKRQDADQRDLDRIALRADVENEYHAKGDPRGTYGRHMPPLFGEEWS
jgi:hypothetical protein